MMKLCIKKWASGFVAVLGALGLGLGSVGAAEPMSWDEFGKQQRDVLVDGTVGQARSEVNGVRNEFEQAGQSWRNADQSWKSEVQNTQNRYQAEINGVRNEFEQAGQNWRNVGQNWKQDMQNSLNGYSSGSSGSIGDQVLQKVDEKTNGTVSQVQGIIREGQGLQNDWQNLRQNFQNAGDNWQEKAKQQALQRVDSATGGVIGEARGTVNDFNQLKSSVKDLRKTPTAVKTQMLNRVDSELKDVTQVMNVTGDFKGAAGSAMALGDIKSMAQQSFGGAAQFDADHLFGGGIVQRLVDEFAKHSIGSIADKGSAFSSIQSAIGGLSPGGGFLGDDLKMLGDAQADFNALRNHNLSQRAGNMMGQIQSDVQQMVAGKVAGVVNGAGNLIKKNQVQLKISGMPHGGTINFGDKSASIGDKYGSITAFHEGADGMADMIGSIGQGLGQLMDPRAMTALQLQSFFSKAGAGIPSIDPLNGALGVFNVESVYGHSYEYEDMRDLNMQYCSAMGVSESSVREAIKSGSTSAGAYCCEQWLDVQAHSLNTMVGLLTSPGNIVDALFSASVLKEYCCATSPGICETVGSKKAECVNGALAGGSSAETAWQQCGVECGNSGYADLVYNPETGYDPQQVEEVVKGCYKTEPWVPSNTVLSSSEMSPIVPAGVKDVLVNGRSAMQKASSTLNQAPTNLSNQAGGLVGDTVGQALGATGISGLVGEVNSAVGGVRNEVQSLSNEVGGIVQ